MADTLRQRLVDAVLTRLRTIAISAGYATDVGQQVFEWRDLDAMPFDEQEIEGLSVKDSKEEATQQVSNHHDKSLQFDIVFATSKFNTPQQVAQHCRKIIGDVEKCIGVDRKWTVSGTQLAYDTSAISVNEMDVKQAGKVIGGGKLIVTIKYRHKSFDPFTQ